MSGFTKDEIQRLVWGLDCKIEEHEEYFHWAKIKIPVNFVTGLVDKTTHHWKMMEEANREIDILRALKAKVEAMQVAA